jgi:hypothetical protein
MAKAIKTDDQKINSESYADLRGLNKFQRFALVKQYSVEEYLYTVEEWDAICIKINL